jgi:phospholipase C
LWNVAQNDQSAYDLSVYGPNGFLRTFRGSVSPKAKANLDIEARYDVNAYDKDDIDLVLAITNRGPVRCRVSVTNAYDRDAVERELHPGQSFDERFSLRASFGWYDLAVAVDTDRNFLRRLAGHVENGRDSASDPAIGAVGLETHASSGAPAEVGHLRS